MQDKEVRTKLTKDDIYELIENCMRKCLKVIAEDAGGEFTIDKKLCCIMNDSEYLFNAIFFADLKAADIDHEINAVVEKMGKREFPDRWMISPKSKTDDLWSKLLNHGFYQEEVYIGMKIYFDEVTFDGA